MCQTYFIINDCENLNLGSFPCKHAEHFFDSFCSQMYTYISCLETISTTEKHIGKCLINT